MVEFKSIPMYQIRGTERRAEKISTGILCKFFSAGSLSVRTELVLSHTSGPNMGAMRAVTFSGV